MFCLDPELVNRLKELARKQHRSLNNFVEIALLQTAWCEPNEETLEAMREVQNGLNDNTPVDTSSVEAMFRSAGLCLPEPRY